MLNEVKRLSKHSVIYTIGSVINRAAAFLLIPLYTRYLSPSDYGTLEIFYVTSAVLQTLLGMMIAHAALRFYFEYDNDQERKTVISTAFLSVLAVNIIAVFILWRFSSVFSHLLFKTQVYTEFFQLIFIIIALEIIKEICLAFFRAKEYSVLFISVSILQLLLQVGLNIYMVVYLKRGVYGILLGNTITLAVVGIILSLITLHVCGLSFSKQKLKAMVNYSYPFILASFGTVIITNSDRFFLKTYATLGIIGLYALGFRFGMVLKVALIDPFTTSYGPFRFSVMKHQQAKEIYARVFTYFIFIAIFVALFISIFAKNIIQLLSTQAFWPAHKVVPLILLSIILTGVTYMFQTGIFLMKKTKYVFFITFLATVLILVLNRLLIPAFSMYGAALAQILTNLFIALATFRVSQKLYPLRYDFLRLIKIISVAWAIYFLSLLVSDKNIIFAVVIKLLLILSFPLILKIFNFYNKKELQVLGQIKSKIGLKLKTIVGQ